MNESDAERAVGILAGATPGPWSDEAVAVWVDAFVKLDDPAELLAAVEALTLSWTSQYRPALGEVVEAYEARRRLRVHRALPSMAQCDGSGWLDSGAGRVPCARCNPALAEVFTDYEKLASWRSGTPLHLLDVGVERKRNGELRYTGGKQPPACRPAVEGEVLNVSVKRGIEIARQAYEAECKAQGRTPNRKLFDSVIRGVVEVGPGRPRS